MYTGPSLFILDVEFGERLGNKHLDVFIAWFQRWFFQEFTAEKVEHWCPAFSVNIVDIGSIVHEQSSNGKFSIGDGPVKITPEFIFSDPSRFLGKEKSYV